MEGWKDGKKKDPTLDDVDVEDQARDEEMDIFEH